MKEKYKNLNFIASFELALLIFLSFFQFTVCSSAQTSAIQMHVAEMVKPRDVQSCPRRRQSDRKEILTMLIERIMKKLNYCFVNDDRVTVPCHYPGNGKPRRVQEIKSLIRGEKFRRY